MSRSVHRSRHRPSLGFGILAAGLAVSLTAVMSPAASAQPGAVGQGLGQVTRSDVGIVYSNDNGTGHFQLYVVSPGGRVRQLTHLPAGQDAFLPDWSPDGTKVAFSIESSTNDEVYTINSDGTGLRQLTNDPAHSSLEPRWSPDGRRFVLERDRPHGHCDVKDDSSLFLCHLWVMNSDGTHLHRLPFNRHFDDFDPAWSPDGKWLAFGGHRGGLINAIWVMRLSGADLHRITAPLLRAFWPAWSPSGKRIAFSSDANGSLYTVPAAGGHPTKVLAGGTAAHDFNAFASWSHGRIGFASFTPTGTSNLETVRPDGTHLRVLVAGLNDGVPFLDYRAP